MSIKKLFGFNPEKRNYLSETNDKDAFEAAESTRNIRAIVEKQKAFIPAIEYAEPANFAKYGSAYLYYKGAIENILDYYPYDGSDAEQNEFYNRSLDIDKYIFNNLYPRTNGYVHIAHGGWGTQASDTNMWGLPNTLEYITFKGGPGTGSLGTTSLTSLSPNPYTDLFQYGNVYDENIYQTAGLPTTWGSGSRESNLKADFDNGVTVEFWLTTGSNNPLATMNTLTRKQVIFDMWNNEAAASADYGRITLYLTGGSGLDGGAANETSPFRYTVHSGSAPYGIADQPLGTSGSVNCDTLSTFRQYAVRMYNSASNFKIELYIDGELNDVRSWSATMPTLNPKGMMGRLGALQTAPHGESAAAGAGKLSGSIDEFRFWKVAKQPKHIGEYWFTQVRGGVNTDISNTDLGVYYKFNEGITGDTSIDDKVLDYGGRICNGVWTGYPGSGARSTGSAMVESGHARTEYKDPIIYATHPYVINLKTSLLDSGSYHDAQNNTSMLSMLPSWMVEEDEKNADPSNPYQSNIHKMCHIVGTYFDKVSLMIDALPQFKGTIFPSASTAPVPFAQHLPQSLGLYTPDLFIDSNVIESFLNRTATGSFEGDLTETKNLIYLNLYNNLANMFKAKGTEKAIRNVFRSFYIDDSLVRLNIYANNTVYTLDDNVQQTLVERASLNLNTTGNFGGVAYQAKQGTAASNGDARGFISGSRGAGATEAGYAYEDIYGFTAEADVIFPKYFSAVDTINRSFYSCSLFGMHTVDGLDSDDASGAETQINSPDPANFQIYAIRLEPRSKDVYFQLTSILNPDPDTNLPTPSTADPGPFPLLTSSVFPNVYADEPWNFSVRLEPVLRSNSADLPVIPGVVSGANNYSYKLIFRGVNARLGSVQNSFVLTASIAASGGAEFLRSGKRMYAGARRVNITGAHMQASDVDIAGLRYWAKSVDNLSLDQHIIDIDNYGISGTYEPLNPLDYHTTGSILAGPTPDIHNDKTLLLNWNFDNVTSSNLYGNFVVDDMSSGSVEIRENYGWLGNLAGYQHTGYGYGFTPDSSTVCSKEPINTYKFIDPELVVSSDMINLIDDKELIYYQYGNLAQIPSYYYVIEKSMYNAISEEMLKFFAGVIDFNNLIGAPVNRYRERYKGLEKLREIFFRRVTDVSNVEKFVDYYKWFDDALAIIVGQLVPASSDFVSDVYNTIESHVLERNKYWTRFPTIEFIETRPETSIGGPNSPGPKIFPPKTYEPDPGWSMHDYHATSNNGGNLIENTFRDNTLKFVNPEATLPNKDLIASPTVRQVSRPTDRNGKFWSTRANRGSAEITSNNTIVDVQREIYRKVMSSGPYITGSSYKEPVFADYNEAAGTKTPYKGSPQIYVRHIGGHYVFGAEVGPTNIKGGVNSPFANNGFVKNSLEPGGPVDTTGGRFVPENVLVGFLDDMEEFSEAYRNDSLPTSKTRRYLKVNHGRDYEDGVGYMNRKSSKVFPFGIFTPPKEDGDVNSGYSKIVHDLLNTSSLEITNLHQDIYGPDSEIPLQGPFANRFVGGNQHRHIPLNVDGVDRWYNRAEAWKLLLGTCVGQAKTGAIGMAGADYPWPEANEEGFSPYPLTGSPKATRYRDFIAKRPFNIKNILMTTASADIVVSGVIAQGPIGNYQHNYEVVHSVGTYANSLAFNHKQPAMPPEIIVDIPTSSVGTNVRTFLNVYRRDGILSEYDVGYLEGVLNRSIIRGRFAVPGGVDTMGTGYLDFKGSEYSVYNSLPYRYFAVKRPSQISCGMYSQPTGSGTTGIRVYDIHGQDFGLRSHLSRHAGRFATDSCHATGANAPGTDGADAWPAMFDINRNTSIKLKMTNDGDIFNAPTVTVATGAFFDNAYVSFQIPRATRQYAWISGAITGADVRFYGYDTTGYYSSSTGVESYFNWVSGSEAADVRGNYPAFIINNYTIDPISTTETNVLGNSTAIEDYINNDFMTAIQATALSSGSMFNMLATRRGYTFGYGWTLGRNNYHPILRKEIASSSLSVQRVGEISASVYNLPPACFKGREACINIGDVNSSMSFKVAHTNQKILFNDLKLNDIILNEGLLPKTSLESVLSDVSAPLNWLWYKQNVFPSTKNNELSGTLSRLNYNNKFWRTLRSDRTTEGNKRNNSFDIDVTQSCWPLDARSDFTTYTSLPDINADVNANRSVNAGELQNAYSLIHSGVGAVAAAARSLSPGAYYSRAHLLTVPTALVAGCGMPIAETGSIPAGTEIWTTAHLTDWGAGIAQWEAPDQACMVERTGSGYKVTVDRSAPWYDSYDDFRNDALKFNRGYAVIPEFRISEHIEELKQGINKYVDTVDMFSIPGTDITSLTSSFWVDYSNSDFLEYLGVKTLSGMEGKEIRLKCEAVKKFNPYKGFYPAQRTVDLVSQFSRSYAESMNSEITVGGTTYNFSGLDVIENNGGTVRPLMQTLFAPGILYNTIKAGLAVDFPVTTEGGQWVDKFYAGANANQTDNFAKTVAPGVTGSEIFERIPFEAIIYPEVYLANKVLMDNESHPDVVIYSSASLSDTTSDGVYSMMAENFFGEVAEFFLEEGTFTRIESDPIPDTIAVDPKAAYGFRAKLGLSVSGSSTYAFESGTCGTNKPFGRYGGLYFSGQGYQTGSEYPLPQYPIANRQFQQNFTLYSRPTAFGPPISGQPFGTDTVDDAVVESMPKDFSRGVNCWTPPYFDGEAWYDAVFYPTKESYTVDEILTVMSAAYWRFDPGTAATGQSLPYVSSFVNAEYSGSEEFALSGWHINSNVMQWSASCMIGVEDVYEQEVDKFGNVIKEKNVSAGRKVVLQPKMETPHFNFSNKGLHPITDAAGNLTLPTYGSAAVPRGMWHQYGIIEPDPTVGMNFSLSDIPTDWLKFHYDVRTKNSIYNNSDASANGATVYKKMKSLSDLLGFNTDVKSKKLGKLKNEVKITEAVVAIPYVVDTLGNPNDQTKVNTIERKHWIGLSPQRVDAARTDQKGSLAGDSLESAGASIRKLMQKMDRYVLPPQVDWLNNRNLDPFAMYIFEFDYTLDQNDLANIWQNVAPTQTGDYRKVRLQSQSIAHNLDEMELMCEKNLFENENLRWMLFKVKQKSQAAYSNKIPRTAGGVVKNFISVDKETGYTIAYNWPYDYLSFVELVKMDVEVLMKPVVVPTDGDDIFMPKPDDRMPINTDLTGFAESAENKFAESAENKFAESTENRPSKSSKSSKSSSRKTGISMNTVGKKGGSNY